jgi:hypothetical protein
MNKVFIGGSRKIEKLTSDITKKLDVFINDGSTILIGDANGADMSVQKYLSNKKYDNVIVFCMESKCRNNVGNWNVKSIRTDLKTKNFDYYSTKDLEMVNEADYAFMIWDAKSKGTLNNIQNLVKGGKTVLVHLSPEKRSYKVRNLSGLKKLIAKCEQNLFDNQVKNPKVKSALRKKEDDRSSEIKTGNNIIIQKKIPIQKQILQGELFLTVKEK